VRPFEAAITSELALLLHAGVPARGVRLTVRELIVTRFERGPLGAREVSEIVETSMRAACRLARDLETPDELIETVCVAALDAVRGHGGESARWLAEARRAAAGVLDELVREHAEAQSWRWLVRRLPQH
jgi:hypothetical protein